MKSFSAYPPGEIYPSAPQPAGYAPQPYSPPTEGKECMYMCRKLYISHRCC